MTMQNYKSKSIPETPYLRARSEWDNRIGTTVVQAKNWRLTCVLSLILSLGLGIIIFYQVSQSRIIPVIVGIDKTTGEAITLGAITNNKNSYNVGSLEIKYFLSEFIRYVRAVPLDQVVIKQNWIKAYAFLRADASNFLNEIVSKNEESPLKKIGKVIVSIEPITISQIPETSSYQIRWKETQYSPQGQKLEEYKMLGTFLIEVEPPKDEETILINPLGLYIKSFQWNREL